MWPFGWGRCQCDGGSMWRHGTHCGEVFGEVNGVEQGEKAVGEMKVNRRRCSSATYRNMTNPTLFVSVSDVSPINRLQVFTGHTYRLSGSERGGWADAYPGLRRAPTALECRTRWWRQQGCLTRSRRRERLRALPGLVCQLPQPIVRRSLLTSIPQVGELPPMANRRYYSLQDVLVREAAGPDARQGMTKVRRRDDFRCVHRINVLPASQLTEYSFASAVRIDTHDTRA